jgi:hypothetical protein
VKKSLWNFRTKIAAKNSALFGCFFTKYKTEKFAVIKANFFDFNKD